MDRENFQLQNMQTTDDTNFSSDSGSNTGGKGKEFVLSKGEEKIKAYVDFSEFNKNYEEYLEKQKRTE